MSTTKRRRGFKGKVALRSLYDFEPLTVLGAYETDEHLFIELEDGDDMIVDFIYLCENEDAAWDLYADYMEEQTGRRPERRNK